MRRYRKPKNPTRFYVYEHWRSDKNLPFHVGKGTGNRAYQLRYNRNAYHQAVVNKLERFDQSVEVRIVIRDLTEKDAFAEEFSRIKFWKTQGVKLTNLSVGGSGGHSGCRHSEEWCKGLSQRQAQRMKNPELRKRQGDWRRGRKFSEKEREIYKGPKSPEHIEAMRIGAIGRKRPPSRSLKHRANQSAALQALWNERLKDQSYIEKREAKRADRAAAKLAERESRAEAVRIAAAQTRFMDLIRGIADGTAVNCVRCGVLNPLSEFPLSKQKKNGRGSYCKACGVELAVRYRSQNYNKENVGS